MADKGYMRLLAEFESQGEVVTATELAENAAGLYIYDKTSGSFDGLALALPPTLPQVAELGARRFFVAKWQQAPELVLVGGGHVSLAVAALAAVLGWRTSVIDDRPEFVTAARFPAAERRICAPIEQGLDAISNPAACYVIVTRGHKDDYAALSCILRRPAAYVGMIGSRSKTAAVLARLTADGFAAEQLAAVHAPIGLKIGAVTPEEIAVSITAEIIAVLRRSGSMAAMTEIVDGLKQSGRKVLLTIIEKTGSAPRGSGSRMLLLADGTVIGTIGGGSIEYEALRAAQQLLQTGGRCVRTYELSAEAAGSLGMICGGRAVVLLETIEP